MTQLELFAGIGGFGLAGHWAGIETVCQVEIDPFCQKVLQKNFPNAQRHNDIHTFDGTKWRGAVDIISGGFPCQPFSTAGKRKGNDDERALWPEMLRVIREVQPAWVVGENVAGIVSMELDAVLASLESEGYATQAFIIPACAVNAPHRRDRVWIVAHATRCYDRRSAGEISGSNGRQERNGVSKFAFTNEIRDAADANKVRLSNKKQIAKLEGQRYCFNYSRNTWTQFPIKPAIRRGDDGVSRKLDENRLKALGNAIVPQVAYQIFKAIVEYENLNA